MIWNLPRYPMDHRERVAGAITKGVEFRGVDVDEKRHTYKAKADKPSLSP